MNRWKNNNRMKNKLTCFQIYPKTEFACKYNTPLYRKQYSELLVEFEKGFDMKTQKLIFIPTQRYHSSSDENSYMRRKIQEILVENFAHKIKAAHVYKNYHS